MLLHMRRVMLFDSAQFCSDQAMLTKSTIDLPSLASAGEEEPIHYEFDRKFLFRSVYSEATSPVLHLRGNGPTCGKAERVCEAYPLPVCLVLFCSLLVVFARTCQGTVLL